LLNINLSLPLIGQKNRCQLLYCSTVTSDNYSERDGFGFPYQEDEIYNLRTNNQKVYQVLITATEYFDNISKCSEETIEMDKSNTPPMVFNFGRW